ncbi:MAG TPA: hypothetical protein ENI87_14205, partial [bacterium]|nr:hypothetical protein [bacterium]
EVRAEDALGARAIAALLTAFSQWQNDRRSAGNDQKRLAALGSRLDVIEAARNVLVDELPGQRAALDRALPRARLDQARRGLSEPSSANSGDVDVSQALAEIRAELEREGGTDSLRTRARNLKPTRSEQVDELDALVDAIDEARKIEQQIAVLAFPAVPQPPFDDIRRYYAAIDRALQPLVVDGGLPTWASELRASRRDEVNLQAAVVAACAKAWRDWQQLRAGGATMATLAAGKSELEAAVAAARELFPTAADALAAAVPQASLDRAMAEVEEANRVKAWQSAFETANGKLLAVDSIADWQRAEAGLVAAGQALRADLQALGSDPQLARSLRDFDSTCARWRAARQSLAEVSALFARGALSDCESNARLRASAAEGGAEFALLQDLASRCRKAFMVLEETLAIDAARAALEGARDRAKELPNEVSVQIESWLTGLAQLAKAAEGMVVIPAGSTRNPRANVAAFFMASTECSQAEFAAFQNEVRAAMEGDGPVEQLRSVQARFGDIGLDAATFGRMLQRSTSRPELPMEAVTWFEAMAFCRWYGKDLPRDAEWALAAFGDGKQYTFPWGDDEAELRRMSTRLLPVDEGGLSWRRRDGVRLHFLAGNVEEWLQTGPGGEARTAGGRCDMRPRELKAQACGDSFYRRRKTDSRGGVGFRPVLRPRDFTGLAWPR